MSGNIKPVEFPLNQGTANNLLVSPIAYALGVDKLTKFKWEIQETEMEVVREGEPPVMQVKKAFAEGYFTPTQAQFDKWGTDDMYIVKLVAKEVGVELI